MTESYNVAHGERKAQMRPARYVRDYLLDFLSFINNYGSMTYTKYDFRAGDHVAVPFGIGLWHYGIVTSRGSVISNSRKHGGVTEQSLRQFANGRRIRLC